MRLWFMSCAEVLAKLETYCDGELTTRERRRMERHLTGCVPCLDRRGFRITLQRIVREKCGRAEVPDHLVQKIRRALGPGP